MKVANVLPMDLSLVAQPALCLLLFGVLASVPACSLGQGSGAADSDRLIASECWADAYSMGPDFFAAIPYRSTLQIRMQRGSDWQEVSDGLAILIDDIEPIRRRIVSEGAAEDLTVSLPPGVAPPGTPVEPVQGDAPIVHMALYLQQSCHNQNTVLYSVGGTISFRHLFSGDPNESDAGEKYTDASFDVMVGDPRDAPQGKSASAVPPALRSRLTGFFQFYFERGQPGQPFP